jgi:prefoldin subunit 5
MSLHLQNAIKHLEEMVEALKKRVAALETERETMRVEMAQFAKKRGPKANGDSTQPTIGL